MIEKTIRILYVDDYPLDRALVRDALSSHQGAFELVEAASRREFDSILAAEKYDLVLSDFNILGFTGLQVLDAVQKHLPGTPVIIVTGTGSEEVAAQAIKRGAVDYVIKSPQHIRRLPHIILNALDQKRLREERLQAQRELQESEFRYRMVSELTSDYSYAYRVSPDGELEIEWVTGALEKITGFVQPELTASGGWESLLHPEDIPIAINQLKALMQGESQTVEYRIRTKSGEIRWMSDQALAIWDENESRTTHIYGAVKDITERKEAEAKLRFRGEELRMLTARLAESEQIERRRLARELHDQVGQSLAVLGFNLKLIRDQMTKSDFDHELTAVESSIALVDDVIQNIHAVMDDLRPSVLDDHGLFSALSWYAERFAKRTEIKIRVQGKNLEPRLPANVENALFRIVQEALANVARHAKASQAIISLMENGGDIELIITDDGAGFEETFPQEIGQRRGWGLVNMRERAEAVGAVLSVETVVNLGTTIKVSVPKGTR